MGGDHRPETPALVTALRADRPHLDHRGPGGPRDRRHRHRQELHRLRPRPPGLSPRLSRLLPPGLPPVEGGSGRRRGGAHGGGPAARRGQQRRDLDHDPDPAGGRGTRLPERRLRGSGVGPGAACWIARSDPRCTATLRRGGGRRRGGVTHGTASGPKLWRWRQNPGRCGKARHQLPNRSLRSDSPLCCVS